jgi:hypothetical protein
MQAHAPRVSIAPTAPLAGPHLRASGGDGAPQYKSLLYLCEYPPSTMGGAPLIARQLLRGYDMARLHLLCCERMVGGADAIVRASFLPCTISTVPFRGLLDVRPRRVFNSLSWSLNALRVPAILAAARRVVERQRVEALFTLPWRCEFALAAYLLHRETGLPLYVFETDDWEAMNPTLLQGALTRRYHARLLQAAEQLWVISPGMQRAYRERFGVESDFLFHFVDLDRYLAETARADASGARDRQRVEVVYTGSINTMFYDTLREFCAMVNDGVAVDGRPVAFTIYGGICPPEFLGPHVRYGGFVDSSAVAGILADADVNLIAVSFSEEPAVRDLVRTSIFTKTIDYMASGRPVLVVAPRDSAEVEYFGDVAEVVTDPARGAMLAGLERAARGGEAVRERCARGVELVRQRHSMSSVFPQFLQHFVAS